MKKLLLLFASIILLISCDTKPNVIEVIPVNVGFTRSISQPDSYLPMNNDNKYTYEFVFYDPSSGENEVYKEKSAFVKDDYYSLYIIDKHEYDKNTPGGYPGRDEDTIVYQLKPHYRIIWDSIPPIKLSNTNDNLAFYDWIPKDGYWISFQCRLWKYNSSGFMVMDLLNYLDPKVEVTVSNERLLIDKANYPVLVISENKGGHLYRRFYFSKGIGLLKFERYSIYKDFNYCLTEEVNLVECDLR